MYTEKQLREAFTAGQLYEKSRTSYFLNTDSEDEFINSLKEAVDTTINEYEEQSKRLGL